MPSLPPGVHRPAPSPGRACLLAAALGLGLLRCGGGGSGGAIGGPPPGPHPSPLDPPLTPTTQPLHIEGLYVTQGSQRLDRSVPLVQGRPGYLRVFVLANAWSGAAPPVRVRLLDRDGHEILNESIPGPAAGVPDTLRQGSMDQSWNLPLEGSLIQPGITCLASVAGPGNVPAGNLRYPADGSPLPLEVVPAAPLRLVLIPIRTRGRVGLVESGGRTKESWVQSLTRMFPLGQVTVRVGAEFATTFDPHDDVQEQHLLGQLEAMRVSAGATREYYYGVFPARGGNNHTGLGYVPAANSTSLRSAIGWDGHSYHLSLAHELGHNLGLRHAPCGRAHNFPKDVNPAFWYRDGSIGAFGFEVQTATPKDPAVFKDIMSYCPPEWASDFDSLEILKFRAREPLAPAAAAASTAQDCLLVQGVIRHGQAILEPAFQVHREALPPDPGDCVLTTLDAQGRVLETVPFGPGGLADAESDSDLGVFTLVIPMTEAMKASLASLQVSRDGVILGRLKAPGARAHAHQPHPQAARDSHGLAHLQWDPRGYNTVVVLDPGTGAILAMGAGGRLELEVQAPELECRFSDGLHTLVQRVTVPAYQ